MEEEGEHTQNYVGLCGVGPRCVQCGVELDTPQALMSVAVGTVEWKVFQ